MYDKPASEWVEARSHAMSYFSETEKLTISVNLSNKLKVEKGAQTIDKWQTLERIYKLAD